MTPPSFSRFPYASRSHDLLLLAPDHFPALELGKRPALLDPDEVVHVIFVGLVVAVILLRARHGLLHDRMGKAALDPRDHGLILLVARHDALERALRHSAYSDFDFERVARFGLVAGLSCGLAAGEFTPARFCAAMVLTRAMSRRTSRTRAVFSSWPVARWKRRLKRSFLSLSTSSSSWSTVMARASPGFMSNSKPIPRCARRSAS